MKSFTLIETLVTVGIFALVMGVTCGLIVALYTTHNYTWQQSVAVDEARRGIETMTREIREARAGDDGSYPIEKAGDKEVIFYSDIDRDGETERVRYFLGTVSSGNQSEQCTSFAGGGFCDVIFSNFLQGNLKSAQAKVSIEGDFGRGNEYAEVYADGELLGRICQTGCSDCAGAWQGTVVFDVTLQASDNFIQFSADANSRVDANCDWEEPGHSMKVKFELSWEEEIVGNAHQFKKGMINPTSSPVEYPSDQEEISILSSYVRNTPPVFEYFDAQGNQITDYPARLADTKLMKVFLVVNVDPNRPPQDFGLESCVQLRNLKEEY